MVSAAIAAAAASDAAHVDQVTQAFIAQGLEIIKRLGGWDQALPAAQQRYDAQAQEHARAQQNQ